MKKAISTVLSLLLSALTLASCVSLPTSTKQAPEDTASRQTASTSVKTPDGTGIETASGTTDGEEKPDPAKPVIDERFDGETIKFYVGGGKGSLNARSIALGENDDPAHAVNAAVAARNQKVEEELGVKIELTEVIDMQESYRYLQPILASKTYVFDVLSLYQYFDLDLAFGDTMGSFYNYLRMPQGSYLRPEAEYWNSSAFHTLSWKNVALFLTGDLNLNDDAGMFVSFVNATMWDRYKDRIAALTNNPEHYTSVYDLVKNGYWTMDLWCELSDMAYKDLNANGEIDCEDEVGLLVSPPMLDCFMTDCFAAGAGVTYSAPRNEHSVPGAMYGDMEITINTEYNRNVFEKMYTLMCTSHAAQIPWLQKDNGDWYYIMDVFAEGRALLTVNQLSCAETYLSRMANDYCIMPLPLYDRAQFDASSPSLGYKTQLNDAVSQYAISTTVDPARIPAITATMELMGYFSMTMVRPAYYDKALRGHYTDRSENAAILDLIRKGIYADFAVLWSADFDNPHWFARTDYADFTGVKLGRILKREQDRKTLARGKWLKAHVEYIGYIET